MAAPFSGALRPIISVGYGRPSAICPVIVPRMFLVLMMIAIFYPVMLSVVTTVGMIMISMSPEPASVLAFFSVCPIVAIVVTVVSALAITIVTVSSYVMIFSIGN